MIFLKNGVTEIQQGIIKASLSSAQILALNVTKVQVIPPPPVNSFILVQTALVRQNFNTIAYVGAGSLMLISDSLPSNGTFNAQISIGTAMTNSLTRFLRFTANAASPSVTANQYVLGDGISFFLSAAATLGNGTMDAWIHYLIITP